MTRRRPKINPSVRLAVPTPTRAELVRLLAKTKETPAPVSTPVSGPCWIWTGYTDPKGYGQASFRGRQQWAHRLMYALLVRTIPAGREIDHRCKCSSCCNPAHLRMISRASNCREINRKPKGKSPASNYDAENW